MVGRLRPDELLGELCQRCLLSRTFRWTDQLKVRKTPFPLLITTMISSFHAREFSPGNLVVAAAAGNVEHDRLVDLVEKSFGNSANNKVRNPDGNPVEQSPPRPRQS